jgi:Fic family protein
VLRGPSGKMVPTTVGGQNLRAFVPDPLPPDPPLAISGELADRLDRAHLALGRLDAVSTILPDTHLFLYAYVRKEAVLSSQIEGTQSSLSDLMLFELEGAPGAPLDDVVEVSNYVAALEHGLLRIRSGLPLSNRLIREVHARLLAGGSGGSKLPGEFRRSQNWIGGSDPAEASFIPLPPQQVEDAMAELERFLHDEPARTPPLLKAALAHVQFESIHPFLDGNGRVGRLMIPMILCVDGILREPLLYLSLYFKQNRARYYDLLDRVRSDGDWEEWVRFFALGVEQTATGAIATAQRIQEMARTHRAAVQGAGRVAGSALQVHHALLARPIHTIARLAAETRLSVPAVTSSIAALTELGLVREITGRRRGRVFAYGPYLDLLQQGTEPL